MTCSPASPIAVNGTLTIPVQVRASQPGTYNTSAVVTANGDSNTANNGPARNTIVVVRLIAALAIISQLSSISL